MSGIDKRVNKRNSRERMVIEVSRKCYIFVPCLVEMCCESDSKPADLVLSSHMFAPENVSPFW